MGLFVDPKRAAYLAEDDFIASSRAVVWVRLHAVAKQGSIAAHFLSFKSEMEGPMGSFNQILSLLAFVLCLCVSLGLCRTVLSDPVQIPLQFFKIAAVNIGVRGLAVCGKSDLVYSNAGREQAPELG